MDATARGDSIDLPARFAIHRKVGSGAFGNVYDVVDRERDMRVALKTLERMDAMSLYRFKREFRELADIVHPNLVRLHELFCVDERWFFTMDLVHGTTLLEFLRPGAVGSDVPTMDLIDASATGEPAGGFDFAGLDEARLRACLPQLVAGVGALHAAGKLHRDLKPLNVIVDGAGRVVILDFGLVVDVRPDNVKDRFEVVGTPAYMSPEQAVGKAARAESDWYSVGVMLYEALTGRLPFAGSALRMLHLKRTSDPPNPMLAAPTRLADLAALSVRLLDRDPAARPKHPELQSLMAEWSSLDAPAPSSRAIGRISLVVPRQPMEFLVGRGQQLEQMHAAFARVVQGAGTMLRITGRSGMGKSAMVRHFVDSLSHSGQAVVLQGRCYECETVPYKALDSMVDALTRYLVTLPPDELSAIAPSDASPLVRLFPVLRRISAFSEQGREDGDADPREQRSRGFSALRQLIRRLGDRTLLVLWIDDLQWGDVDSAGFLAELFEPHDSPRMLLIASFRQEDVAKSRFLDVFLAHKPLDPSCFVDMEVGPLQDDEAEELASLLLGEQGVRISQPPSAIAAEAKGNPLFLLELVAHIKDVGRISTRPSSDQVVRLDDMLANHVGRLPAGARRLLQTVSLAARAIEIGVARRAAVLGSDVRECLDALRMARLVRTQGLRETDLIEPYHDRIRQVVVASLDAGATRDTHLALGQALEVFGRQDPETLAFHYLGAGAVDKAWTYSVAAADRAASALAFSRAADLYRDALSVCPRDEEFAVRVKLADALANAGRGGEASEAYLSALPIAPGGEGLELRRKAAESSLRVGRIDEGLALVHEGLARAGMRLAATPFRALLALLLRRVWLWLRGMGYRGQYTFDPTLLARIDMGWALAVGLSNSDAIRGAEVQTRTLLLALKAGEPMRIARSLAFEAAFLATAGMKNHARSTRLLAAASALATEIGQPYSLGWALVGASGVAYFEGRWKDCLVHTEAALAAFGPCAGAAWERTTARHYGVWALGYLGQVAEMARRVRALLKEAIDRGDLYSATDLRTFMSNVAWLVDDDVPGARQAIEDAMRSWSKSGFHVQHYYELYAYGQLDLYEGRAASAYDRVTATWPALRRSMLLQVQTVRLESLHLRARCCLALAEQQPDRRHELLAQSRAIARRMAREQGPWGAPTARLVMGAVHHLQGDSGRAASELRAAIDGFDLADMELFAAAARCCLCPMLEGDERARMQAHARDFMAAQTIRRPERWVAMLAPGYAPTARALLSEGNPSRDRGDNEPT
ncbi:MAG: protein kinase [Deltaproteobacteria bacterium]|nr:protein kinase [Deltaproteobacteria bacterium]